MDTQLSDLVRRVTRLEWLMYAVLGLSLTGNSDKIPSILDSLAATAKAFGG